MKSVFAFVLTAVVAGPVLAACPAPSNTVTVPDGTKATIDEMLTAKKAVTEYNAAVETFRSCLDQERNEAIAARGENLTSEERKQIERDYMDRYNTEAGKLEAVATKVNEQIRAYKTAHPST
jgi:outer membrane murein-binding lipoprotein Lpp